MTNTTSLPPTHDEANEKSFALARKCVRELLDRLPPLLSESSPELRVLFSEHPDALAHALRVGISHTTAQLSKIARTLALIRKYHGGPIYFPKIAETVGADRNSLRVLLVKVSGKTFQGILLEARMEKAKWFLSRTRHDTATVARETGFGSYDSMNRAFKCLTGLTPARYRIHFRKVRFRNNRRN